MIDADGWELPREPSEAERALSARLAADGVAAIDARLLACAPRRWQKIASVVMKALAAAGAPHGEAHLDLYVRRVGALVTSGALQCQGTRGHSLNRHRSRC